MATAFAMCDGRRFLVLLCEGESMSLVPKTMLAQGHDCFLAADLEGAARAWREGAKTTQPQGILCAALLHVVASEEALHVGDLNGAQEALARALSQLTKVDANRIPIERDALYDSLVSMWADLKTQTLHSLRFRVLFTPKRRVMRRTNDVQCPHCFETSPVAAEFDEQHGDVMHQDCPVCCRPWEVRVIGDGSARSYEARNPEGDS